MDRHVRRHSGPGGWGRWKAAVVTALLAAGVVCAAYGAALLAGPRAAWLLGAVTSRLFLFCAALLVACAAAFGLLGAMLWQAGRAYRAERRSQEGAAILEFALVLPFLLLLSLLMAQTSLVMVGNVCVHYSAFCAARAAAVMVPKDFGVEEPRNVLTGSSDAMGKLHRLRMAAAWALMGVSCGSEEVTSGGGAGIGDGVSRFFSVQGIEAPAWADDRLGRRFAYALEHTEVAIEPPEVDENDSDEFYDEHEDLHVRVEHTLYLAIPTAAKLFAMFPGGVELGFGDGEYGTVIAAECTMPNEGVQDYVDIETFP